ncbi:carboxypeptidase-like regulatory domain-containing protein [Mesonia aquimarina]|uniref:carboxypeptidase-like regulatory domain-containing protein n=1 Tax=Mesonia aquimarina TaxID=1504967 RepID=UPI000EF5CC0B|nr:carboxypeptidase-like regulatory domain-containing protein [Mesonia aquimarina]
MKNTLILSVFLIFSASHLLAQKAYIKGTVKDAITSELLPDVTITIEDSSVKSNTNSKGEFRFNEPAIALGNQIIRFEKEGYITKRFPVIIKKDEVLDLSAIELKVAINEENLQIGVISLSDNELTSEEGTASNFTGLLQASKDVFLKAAAYDFSATFFNPRGYDNANGTILINGIEMNKQYSGRPQWSSWGGLNDVQRNQVFSMGIEANDYNFGGIAGTNNIIMRATQYQKGGRVSYASANRSYRGRVMGSYHTGIGKGGWAFSFLVSRRFGNEGFKEGTLYDANSIFLSVEKKLSEKHSLNFTAFYTPNRRGKSTAITQEVRDLKSIEYNPLWGYQNGEIRNSRIKEVAEPVLMLNHFWDISNTTSLNTNLALQTGKIGNTRIDNGGTRLVYSADDQVSYVGGARNPTPEYYQNLPSYHLRSSDLTATNYQSAYLAEQEFQNNGQLNWGKLYNANLNRTGGNSVYVIQEDRQDDTQITANTIMSSQLNNYLTLNGRLNFRYLKSENFAELNDLLGGNGYLDVDFFAEEGEGVSEELSNIAQSDLNNINRVVEEGERYKYNYEINATVISAFAQAQFHYNVIDFFIGANFSKTSYQRIGLFQNGYFKQNSFGKSEQLSFNNPAIKGGFTYRITGRHVLQSNIAYVSKAPTIKNSFSNARQNNEIVQNLQSEKMKVADVSYLYRSPMIKARLTGFYANFRDKTDIGFYFTQDLAGLGLDNGDAFVQEIVTNINQQNLGVEFGIEAQITSTVKLKASGSIAQYVYTNNPNLYLTSDDFSKQKSFGNGKTNLKNYHVANGPERALQIGFEYRDPDYWFVSATSNYFANAYIDPSALRRSSNFILDYDGLPIANYNPTKAKQLLRQEEFSDYMLVNIIGGKSFKVDDYFIGFFATINNVFNQEYKTGGFEQSRYGNYTKFNEDQSRTNGALFGNRYFFGYGTTYYMNVYIRF